MRNREQTISQVTIKSPSSRELVHVFNTVTHSTARSEVICVMSQDGKFAGTRTFRPDLHKRHGIPLKSIFWSMVASDEIVIRK